MPGYLKPPVGNHGVVQVHEALYQFLHYYGGLREAHTPGSSFLFVVVETLTCACSPQGTNNKCKATHVLAEIYSSGGGGQSRNHHRHYFIHPIITS